MLRARGRLFPLLALMAACGLWPAGPMPRASAARDKPDVLVLVSAGHSIAGFRIVDRVLQPKLEAAGYRVAYGTYDDLTWDTLKQFNVAVVMMLPLKGASHETWVRAYEAYKKIEPLLYRFVDEGGGLYIIDDIDGYSFRADLTLNDLLAPWGAKVLPQIIDEPDRSKCHYFDEWFSVVRTEDTDCEHPILQGVAALWWMRHGTVPLQLDENWTVLARTNDDAVSHPMQLEHVPDVGPTTGPGAPWIAARSVGRGRVLVYSTYSTFTFLNGYHPKWGGWCLEQDGGLRYVMNALDWLGAPSLGAEGLGDWDGNQAKILDLEELKERTTTFPSVPPEDQPPKGRVFQGIIGPRTTISGGDHTVAEFCEVARAAGLDFVIFIETDPASEGWNELVAQCKANSEPVAGPASGALPRATPRAERGGSATLGSRASTDGFLAIPGVEFDAENGNSTIAFDLSAWPPPNKTTVNLMLNSGAVAALAAAHPNGLPPNLVGFVDAMEVYGFGPDLSLTVSQKDMFSTLQAHDWFLVPLAVYRITDPAKLSDFHGYRMIARAPELSKILQSFHGGMRNAYMSSGPRVDGFWFEGAGVVDDYFEGRNYIWVDDADVARLHIDVSADRPLASVTLLLDGKVYMAWDPGVDAGLPTGALPRAARQPGSARERQLARRAAGQAEFHTVLDLPSDQSTHSLWLEARDDADGEAISGTLRTRSTFYWAHGGGDRANTYDGNYVEDPNGLFYWLGHTVSGTGTVDFDLCRGSANWVCPYPPRLSSEITPASAFETGSPQGGMGNYQTGYPRIFTTQGIKPPNAVPTRYGYQPTGGDAHIIDEDNNENYTLSQGAVARVVADPNFKFHNRFTMFRWRAHGAVTILFEREIVVKQDIQLADRPDGPEVEMLYAYMKDWSRDKLSGYTFVNESGEVESAGGIDFRNGPQLVRQGRISAHGFVGLWKDPWGNPAIYGADDQAYDFAITSNPAAVSIGFEMPDRILPRGTRLTARLLFTFTDLNEPTGEGRFSQFWREFGFTGAPKWSAQFYQGRLLGSTYAMDVVAFGGGARFRLRGGKLINPLPLRITGINPDWEVGLVDARRGTIRRTWPWGGLGYLVLDPPDDAPSTYYAGNLVICDRPSVRLRLVRVREGRAEVEAYNMLDNPVSGTIRVPDVTGVLKGGSARFTLGAKQSAKLTVP